MGGDARVFSVVKEVSQQKVVVGVLRAAKIGHDDDGVALIGFRFERIAKEFAVAGVAVNDQGDGAGLVGGIGDVVVDRDGTVAQVSGRRKGEGTGTRVGTAVQGAVSRRRRWVGQARSERGEYEYGEYAVEHHAKLTALRALVAVQFSYFL